MKTLKLLIKMSLFNKSMILCASILSNKSLMEEATVFISYIFKINTFNQPQSKKLHPNTTEASCESHLHSRLYTRNVHGNGIPNGNGNGNVNKTQNWEWE